MDYVKHKQIPILVITSYSGLLAPKELPVQAKGADWHCKYSWIWIPCI